MQLETLCTAPPRPNISYIDDISQNDVSLIMEEVQKIISSFEYNYVGKPYISMKPSFNAIQTLKCAADIIELGYPIQCVEATFIGLYLTRNNRNILRIPLNFKSKFRGNIFRHMVLAVCERNSDGTLGRWGAVGISRRADLMFKPLQYTSFFELVCEFQKCYKSNLHSLEAVYPGLPFPYISNKSTQSNRLLQKVVWKVMKIPFTGCCVLKDDSSHSVVPISEEQSKEYCDLFVEYILTLQL